MSSHLCGREAESPRVQTMPFSCSKSVVPKIRGGHRHVIAGFSGLRREPALSVYSKQFKVGIHEFQIVCYPGGEVPGLEGQVSLFLGFRGPSDKCVATWSLRCINQKNPEQTRERKWEHNDKYNTFSIGRRWGWQKFMRINRLLDPEVGFVVNDTVIFESVVVVHDPVVCTMEESSWHCGMGPLEQGLPRPPSPSLPTDLLMLFESSNNADCQFTFQDGTAIAAHTQILSARSSVFAKMFSGHFREGAASLDSQGSCANQTEPNNGALEGNQDGAAVNTITNNSNMQTIPVVDTTPNVFRELLKFVYSGQVQGELLQLPKQEPPSGKSGVKSEFQSGARKAGSSSDDDGEDAKPQNAQLPDDDDDGASTGGSEDAGNNRDVVMELMFIADYYEVNRLRLLCEHYIFKTLTVENAVPTFMLVDMHSSQLRPLVLQFMACHVGQVMEQPEFGKEMSKDFVIELLAAVETRRASMGLVPESKTKAQVTGVKRKFPGLKDMEEGEFRRFVNTSSDGDLRFHLSRAGLSTHGGRFELESRALSINREEW